MTTHTTTALLASEPPLDTHSGVPRIHARTPAQALAGAVRWSPVKSLFWFAMAGAVLIFGWQTLSWGSFFVFLLSTAIVLCFGHSLGTHRRLVHNSYACPLWLEYLFVWLGTLVGMAGPLTMLRTHDTRDWAQRQPHCHDYFAHRSSFWRDGWWQMHCGLQLDEPPQFTPESRVANSRFYAWLERTWLAQQLIPAVPLYLWGGWDFIVWGVCARVAVCNTGHWLIGHFAHRDSPHSHRHWHVSDAGVQGYNVHLSGLLRPLTALLTFGECWHNNHHAFPGSARLGLQRDELDPGWWVLRLLQACGWAKQIKLPSNLPERESLHAIHPS